MTQYYTSALGSLSGDIFYDVFNAATMETVYVTQERQGAERVERKLNGGEDLTIDEAIKED